MLERCVPAPDAGTRLSGIRASRSIRASSPGSSTCDDKNQPFGDPAESDEPGLTELNKFSTTDSALTESTAAS